MNKLSRLERFLLEKAQGGKVLVTETIYYGSCYNTGAEVSARDLRVKFFGQDTRSAQASFSRALRRLVKRGLLVNGDRIGNCHRYALPGTRLIIWPKSWAVDT